MKIVVLPGVGFHTDKTEYKKFSNNIIKNLSDKNIDCECDFFYWEHDLVIPHSELPYTNCRKWLAEVILDFQQVVKHAFNMKIPEADYYIGHSAGSVLALAQENKSCVIFGSPAILIESLNYVDQNKFSIHFQRAINKNNRFIYNIVNKYDQLAYPIYNHNNIKNHIYQNAWYWFNTYNPIVSHLDYWSNSKIIKKISDALFTMEKEPRKF